MKKIILLGFTAIMFSCSSDDSSSSINASLLTKKWYFKNTVIAGVTSEYNDHQPGCGKDYIEFLPGGVFKSVDIYDQDCLEDIDTASWDLSGSTLTITFPEEAETNIINSVTATTLQTQTTYDADEDGQMDVVTFNFTAQ